MLGITKKRFNKIKKGKNQSRKIAKKKRKKKRNKNKSFRRRRKYNLKNKSLKNYKGGAFKNIDRILNDHTKHKEVWEQYIEKETPPIKMIQLQKEGAPNIFKVKNIKYTIGDNGPTIEEVAREKMESGEMEANLKNEFLNTLITLVFADGKREKLKLYKFLNWFFFEEAVNPTSDGLISPTGELGMLQQPVVGQGGIVENTGQFNDGGDDGDKTGSKALIELLKKNGWFKEYCIDREYGLKEIIYSDGDDENVTVEYKIPMTDDSSQPKNPEVKDEEVAEDAEVITSEDDTFDSSINKMVSVIETNKNSADNIQSLENMVTSSDDNLKTVSSSYENINTGLSSDYSAFKGRVDDSFIQDLIDGNDDDGELVTDDRGLGITREDVESFRDETFDDLINQIEQNNKRIARPDARTTAATSAKPLHIDPRRSESESESESELETKDDEPWHIADEPGPGCADGCKNCINGVCEKAKTAVEKGMTKVAALRAIAGKAAKKYADGANDPETGFAARMKKLGPKKYVKLPPRNKPNIYLGVTFTGDEENGHYSLKAAKENFEQDARSWLSSLGILESD